jgi:hypothetical protein
MNYHPPVCVSASIPAVLGISGISALVNPPYFSPLDARIPLAPAEHFQRGARWRIGSRIRCPAYPVLLTPPWLASDVASSLLHHVPKITLIDNHDDSSPHARHRIFRSTHLRHCKTETQWIYHGTSCTQTQKPDY